MSAKSIGEVSVRALEAFAKDKLDAAVLPGFTKIVADLIAMGVVAAIDEANTARVSGESLTIVDTRKA